MKRPREDDAAEGAAAAAGETNDGAAAAAKQIKMEEGGVKETKPETVGTTTVATGDAPVVTGARVGDDGGGRGGGGGGSDVGSGDKRGTTQATNVQQCSMPQLIMSASSFSTWH